MWMNAISIYNRYQSIFTYKNR